MDLYKTGTIWTTTLWAPEVASFTEAVWGPCLGAPLSVPHFG